MSFLPDDALRIAGERWLYNIAAIEKKFARKRPCGLELDIDTGKVVQVITKKQRKLSPSEIESEMKKSLLAPSNQLGNGLISSPFIDSMTASKKTKIRVQKHNKRFERQLNQGYDHSSLLFADEEENEEEEFDENCEVQPLYDMDEAVGDDLEEEDDEEEEEIAEEESQSEDDGDEGESQLEDKEKLPGMEAEFVTNPDDMLCVEDEEEPEQDDNKVQIRVTRSLVRRVMGTFQRKKPAAKASAKNGKKKKAQAKPVPAKAPSSKIIVQGKAPRGRIPSKANTSLKAPRGKAPSKANVSAKSPHGETPSKAPRGKAPSKKRR